MAYDAEGTIYIPLADFWDFVRKFHPKFEGEVNYGVPRVSTSGDMEIDYAVGSETAPADWSREPKAVTQWKDLKKNGG